MSSFRFKASLLLTALVAGMSGCCSGFRPENDLDGEGHVGGQGRQGRNHHAKCGNERPRGREKRKFQILRMEEWQRICDTYLDAR
jgi:hypothetical protein